MSEAFLANNVNLGAFGRLLATIEGTNLSPGTRDTRLLIAAWLALIAFSTAVLAVSPQ